MNKRVFKASKTSINGGKIVWRILVVPKMANTTYYSIIAMPLQHLDLPPAYTSLKVQRGTKNPNN